MLANITLPRSSPKPKNSTSFATHCVVNTVCMERFSNQRYSVTS